MSLFQDTSIGGENPQSREEDEELEEQKRRQEELADLLASGIHAFNYDDSTMNSSLTSVEEPEPNYQETIKIQNNFKYEDSGKTSTDASRLSDLQQKYKDVNQQEQLQILYDVRVREINNLRNEFNNYRDEKEKEIKTFKNKLTLSEAEIRHLQITLTNSESLLVEKNDIIKNFKEQINSKAVEIERLNKLLEEQNLEICTYKSTVNELQLRLVDNNPFNTGNRKLNSEKLQKAHQDQIIKLETLLQEQSKKVEILEKEKLILEEDIKKLISHRNDSEKENNLTIMALSKKLQATQQQCKDLYILGEAIKKESDHFKERLAQLESNKLNIDDLTYNSFKIKDMDKDAIMIQLEKLKRMLLDKDTELNTLKSKLKFYDSDLSELFELREILNKMYSYEVKPCNNLEHEELIIFMQKQLQSYQQAIEDRNNQIINLNMLNKELQEKIEETIQQTRTDIQNISQKYSLPQLETMNRELRNAEKMINALKQELTEKEEVIGKLLKKSKSAEKENDLELLKNELLKKENEKQKLMDDLIEYKKTETQLSEENEKVKTQLQKICLKLGLSEADIFESDSEVHELKTLRSKYGQIHDQLQQVLVHLETMNVKRTNFNIIFTLKKQIQSFLNLTNEQNLDQKVYQDKLEQWYNMISDFVESLKHCENSNHEKMLDEKIIELMNAKTILEGEKVGLEDQIKIRMCELEEAHKEISALKDKNNNLNSTVDEYRRAIEKLNDKIDNLNKCLEIAEANKHELEKQLENTQKQLKSTTEETIDLHKKMTVVGENSLRQKLFQDLKEVENELEKSRDDTSLFQKCLQAELLKKELLLRECLQQENVEKMQKIESQYKKVITDKVEMHRKEKEKWKRLEENYRQQFAQILEECGKRMQVLENENDILNKKIASLVQDYKTFKTNAVNEVEKQQKIVLTYKKAIEDKDKQWDKLLQYYMLKYARIEKIRRKSRQDLEKKISSSEAERKIIEDLYDDKIRKLKQDKLDGSVILIT